MCSYSRTGQFFIAPRPKIVSKWLYVFFYSLVLYYFYHKSLFVSRQVLYFDSYFLIHFDGYGESRYLRTNKTLRNAHKSYFFVLENIRRVVPGQCKACNECFLGSRRKRVKGEFLMPKNWNKPAKGRHPNRKFWSS